MRAEPRRRKLSSLPRRITVSMSEASYRGVFLQAAQPTNPLLGFLPMILIFGIFYFLLFMPMQRQKKQQREMLASAAERERGTNDGRYHRNGRFFELRR